MGNNFWMNYKGKFTWNTERSTNFACMGKEESNNEKEEKVGKIHSVSNDSFSGNYMQIQLSDNQQGTSKLQEPKMVKCSQGESRAGLIALRYNAALPEGQSKIHLVDTSKSQAPNSVSGSVNGMCKNAASELSAYPRTVSGNTVTQGTAISLADLAKQHKSQRAKVSSLNTGTPVIFQKVNGISNLPAQIKSPIVSSRSDHLGSLVGTLDNKVPEKLNRQDAKSVPVVVGSSSSTSSLIDLSKAYLKSGGNSSSVSLSQLIQQHKNSSSSLPGMSTQSSQIKAAKPSLASLLRNVKLEDTDSSQCHKSSVATDASTSLIKHADTAPNVSLEACLKTSKTSSTVSRKPLNAQQEEAIEDSIMTDIPSQVDALPHQLCLDMPEKITQTNLMSQASCLGMVLCYTKLKRSLKHAPVKSQRPLKYPKFMCSTQVGDRKMYIENVYHKIEPFNFSTPSPDDLVKSKQKHAFTRPNKEFEL